MWFIINCIFVKVRWHWGEGWSIDYFKTFVNIWCLKDWRSISTCPQTQTLIESFLDFWSCFFTAEKTPMVQCRALWTGGNFFGENEHFESQVLNKVHHLMATGVLNITIPFLVKWSQYWPLIGRLFMWPEYWPLIGRSLSETIFMRLELTRAVSQLMMNEYVLRL